MSFLESEKSKAIRWFRNFADLLESGQAELQPQTLSREDYGTELRLSGTIIPGKNPPKKVSSTKPFKVEQTVQEVQPQVPQGRMTPAQAQQCYRPEQRNFLCPKCNKFTTTSETGLKKHFNRCKG